MDYTIKETARRRAIQEAYNKEHGIIPKTIVKEIKDIVTNDVKEDKSQEHKMSKKEREQTMFAIEEQMKEAAKNLDFERATELRDILFEMRSEK
jgi:excinuclease ABC subunit B